ncbi:hypothetical protein KCP71_15370 [Salmonella enterica subsp. enterica]|nr:hypothetical protein KCP71_15370 [Salmonella enterica subsp. enterica]
MSPPSSRPASASPANNGDTAQPLENRPYPQAERNEAASDKPTPQVITRLQSGKPSRQQREWTNPSTPRRWNKTASRDRPYGPLITSPSVSTM